MLLRILKFVHTFIKVLLQLRGPWRWHRIRLPRRRRSFRGGRGIWRVQCAVLLLPAAEPDLPQTLERKSVRKGTLLLMRQMHGLRQARQVPHGNMPPTIFLISACRYFLGIGLGGCRCSPVINIPMLIYIKPEKYRNWDARTAHGPALRPIISTFIKIFITNMTLY